MIVTLGKRPLFSESCVIRSEVFLPCFLPSFIININSHELFYSVVVVTYKTDGQRPFNKYQNKSQNRGE